MLKDELAYEISHVHERPALLEPGCEVIVYGSGNGGRIFLEMHRERFNLKVLFAVDDNPARHGQKLKDYDICPPGKILEHPNATVVLALAQRKPVIERLVKMGVRKYVPSDGFPVHIRGPVAEAHRAHFDPAVFEKVWGELDWLDSQLADEASKKTLRAWVRFRLSLDFAHLYTADYPQYEHPVVHGAEGDVVIDGGAWEGDTAELFSRQVGEGEGKVYSFEPSGDTYQKLLKTAAEKKLHQLTPVNAALGKADGYVTFSVDAYDSGSSHVANVSEASEIKEQERVELVSIDSFSAKHQIKPSLIKMDIEGSELDALAGAEQVIREYKPKLQICVYHKAADLWEIPRRIKTYHPNYRLYLAQHGFSWHEVVLYAINASDTKDFYL